MKICTIDEMRAIEEKAVAVLGLSTDTLMENAAHAICDVIRYHLPLAPSSLVAFVCGPGSNGTLGLISARQLHAYRRAVKVISITQATECSDNRRHHFEIAARCGVPCVTINSSNNLAHELPTSGAIVDALLGPTPDVTPLIADTIDTINKLNALNKTELLVVSIDTPSGVCGNTGSIPSVAIDAHATVALGLPKRGNVVPPGVSRGGKLFVSSMSLPPHLLDCMDRRDALVELVQPDPLPHRLTHGHKGTFGDIVFIAGAGTYYGAPVFAALASLRAGAGYARLACPASMTPALATIAPEVVFVPQRETDAGSLCLDNIQSLVSLANHGDFVVIGPGISTHDETQLLARDILAHISRPVLIDGDGLTAVVGHTDLIQQRQAPTILTPHVGEMARLLGVSVGHVARDPIESAKHAAISMGCYVVLKGYRSVVANPDGYASINTSGNDGMGTAGSGDVLSGTIAAMVGLGLPPERAARTGVFIHGLAGDLAMRAVGPDGMTARDILEHLSAAVWTYRTSRAELLVGFHGACTSV